MFYYMNTSTVLVGVATNRRHGFTRAEAEDLKAPERYVRDGDVIGPQPVFQVVA